MGEEAMCPGQGDSSRGERHADGGQREAGEDKTGPEVGGEPQEGRAEAGECSKVKAGQTHPGSHPDGHSLAAQTIYPLKSLFIGKVG